MPAVSPKLLVNKIIESIQESCGKSAYVSEKVTTNPRKFLVSYAGKTYSLWVYIWTLTPGGRPNLPDEYRIQMTSVSSPLSKNPDGLTVLMGYKENLNVFAGFDLVKHDTFTVGSPSVQIDISALNAALQNGLSFTTKSNDEIAIGVRSDNFLTYCLNAQSLHSCAAESGTTTLLEKAVSLSEKISDHDISLLTADRRQIVKTVSRYSRDANFRKKVLGAYENRCAVTRIQLKLVDAAHILPVPSEDSSDDVTNGVALSPTFHRAYDNCLIYLDEDFVMRLNSEKISDLAIQNLDGGLRDFQSFLDKKIHLPFDINQRPRVEYIKMANRYRRIPGYI
jgi:putative restriction endonuclease